MLRLMLLLVAPLSLDRRRKVLGFVTEWLVRLTPLHRRADRNLALVWPDRPAEDLSLIHI